MKFLLKRKFNYLDLIGLFLLISLWSAGLWFMAIIWLVIGPQIVSMLEDRYGDDDG